MGTGTRNRKRQGPKTEANKLAEALERCRQLSILNERLQKANTRLRSLVKGKR